VPEDYINYFRQHNVTAVVRLNKRMYESSRFSGHGVRHHEMYFPDGTCPSEQILLRFLDVAEREPGALAVSCSLRRVGAQGPGWTAAERCPVAVL
jgi:cell division cycle 14